MNNGKTALLAAAMMMSVPTISLAAMAASNTVNSAAIVDGSIATADIANSAVTAAKIASGTITATQLATGSVTATQIAAGSVSDAKITGPISLSKLPVGTSATTVAAGNHTHSGAVKYAQVVVVAKSGGDSTNPASAVAAITDASAAKPYLVKVMPGVYDIGSSSVVMKPFVYLEGSGDSSVIKSKIGNAISECVVGTINMANNSSVKNVRVINSGSAPAGVDSMFAAVVFKDVKATLESVSVYAGGDTLNVDEAVAVCSQGVAAVATVNNAYLEAHSATGNSDTVSVLDHSTMLISNSKIYGIAGESNHVIDCHNFALPDDDSMSMANITITNSYIEGSALPGTNPGNQVYWGDGCKSATIENSTIAAIGGEWAQAVTTTRNTNIINSKIIGPVNIDITDNTDLLKIANSNIQGEIANPSKVKLFNCFDGDFNPIPNN
jgi:hypothetical protein